MLPRYARTRILLALLAGAALLLSSCSKKKLASEPFPDVIGTPFCLTVDVQSLEDQTVTVRDRDTMAQERVPTAELQSYLEERLV